MIGERIDLGHGAFLHHAAAFIPAGPAAAMFASLAGEVAWEQREIVLFGRPVLQPRLVGWAGSLPYRYSGQTLPPRALTPTVAALIARINGVLAGNFNHVLLNQYRDGLDSMGMHADAEPELGPDPQVATLSLGATRRMVIAGKKKPAARVNLLLGPGDLLVMGGTCQRHFVHGIPKQPSATAGPRISLTFRQVLRPPAKPEKNR